MATFTIKSKKHGDQVFTVNENGGYVRCNGKQICDKGSMIGSTISIRGTDDIEKSLETIARKWWNQYLRNAGQYE
jgi:sensor histidine kinase regulating citrate/malate metabolism